MSKIGAKYGVQAQTIKRLLDSQNIKIKSAVEAVQKINSLSHNKILKLYVANTPICKIAEGLNVSSCVIKRILEKNNVEIKKKGFYLKKITKENEEEIVKLFKSGFTKRKIAELFNVSSTTIRRILEKNDIKSVKKIKQI